MSADTAKDGLDFTTQRFLALVAAATAVLPETTCHCYHIDSREYGPNHPCPKCRLETVLGIVPEAPDYDHNADWTPSEWIEAQQ